MLENAVGKSCGIDGSGTTNKILEQTKILSPHTTQQIAIIILYNVTIGKGAHRGMFTALLTPPSGSDPKTYLATRGG